ncbi:MAG: hypothetical protein JOZ07_06475 [Solirubrobacterales bacterium]|nr:hypothetical protein [Solirubrobacterales bacterium]
MVIASLCSALALAAVAQAGTPPRSALQGFACHAALRPADRSVAIRAVMRPLPGTQSLQLRFQLLEQPAGSSSFTEVTGGRGLGVWLTPQNPTLGQRPGDIWELTKPVLDLAAPARYHFRVSFRWIGAHDRVLSTEVRTSAACRQRELRPDLLVAGVAVSAISGRPGAQRYTATIANRGLTAAGPFQVLFTPGDGSAAQTRTLRLGARASRREVFVGPVCNPASPPTVVADSLDQVDDYDRDNNALTVTCPA